MRIAILGPGGVGGFLAGALARAGEDVTIVAREETAEAIARGGLAVESVRLGDFVVRPRAVARLDEDADALVVATKSASLEPALERIDAEPGLVVPLLNGLDHVPRLRAHYGARAVAGAIRIEATREAPGQILHTSPFLRVDVASDDPAPRPAVEAFVNVLRAAEVPANVGASEAQVLWGKLVRLNALACTTTAYDATLGQVRSRAAWRAELVAAVEEGAEVARAEGAEVDPDAILGELWDAHAGLRSSMARDVEAGREPELDAIAGAVLRAGRRHGVACPAIEALADAIAERLAARPA